MTAQRTDTYAQNKGSFWLGFLLGLLLILVFFVVLLILLGRCPQRPTIIRDTRTAQWS